MLFYAVLFFVLAIVAAIFGFGGIASAFASVAQLLFFVFIVLLVVFALMHVLRGRPPV
ncbi:MAG: DUF1328 domain-containing protein [Alphaproteobacteria bacterium]